MYIQQRRQDWPEVPLRQHNKFPQIFYRSKKTPLKPFYGHPPKLLPKYLFFSISSFLYGQNKGKFYTFGAQKVCNASGFRGERAKKGRGKKRRKKKKKTRICRGGGEKTKHLSVVCKKIVDKPWIFEEGKWLLENEHVAEHGFAENHSTSRTTPASSVVMKTVSC